MASTSTRGRARLLWSAASLLVLLALLALLRSSPRTSPLRAAGSAQVGESVPEEAERVAPLEPGTESESALTPDDGEEGETRRTLSGSIAVYLELECSLGRSPDLSLLAEDGRELHRALVVSPRTPVVWDGLEPGSYTVVAGGDGWRPARERVDVDRSSAAVPVRLRMTTESNVRGVVVDARSGQPLQSFQVSVETRSHAPSGVPTMIPLRTVDYSQTGGRYCYAGLPTQGAGAPVDGIRVHVRAEGYADYEGEWIDYPGPGFFGRVDVALEPLQDILASVSGHVIDVGTGEPVAGAEVGFVGADEEHPTGALSVDGELVGMEWISGAGESARDTVRTDEEGAFSIDLRGGGRVRLVALDEEHAPCVSEVLELMPGERQSGHVLAMEAGATIEGRVAAGAGLRSGQGVAVRLIELPDGMERWSAVKDGAFGWKGLPPGSYRASLFVDPSGKAVGPFSNSATAQESQDVSLRSGARASMVFGREEAEAEDTPLHVQVDRAALELELTWVAGLLDLDAGGKPWASTGLDGEGGAVFARTPEGSCGVFVGGADSMRSPTVVAMAFAELPAREKRPGAVVSLDASAPVVEGQLPAGMEAERGARVRVHVVSCTPAWAAGAVDGRELTPDPSGRFWLRGLPPGDYEFAVPGTSRRATVHLETGFQGTLYADLE